MFRNLNSDGHLLDGKTSPSSEGHGLSASGLVAQESPGTGLFSGLTRPAVSLLQRLLPGRSWSPRSACLSEPAPGWLSGDIPNSFVHEEREFFRQLGNIQPGPSLSLLQCDPDGAVGLLQPGPRSDIPWLTAGTLQAEEMDAQFGYFSSLRTAVNHLLSFQELRPGPGKDWGPQGSSSSIRSSGVKTWWGSLWGDETSPDRGLQTWTGSICPQPVADKTKAAETDPKVPENPGAPEHKEEAGNNNTTHYTTNSKTEDSNDKTTHYTTHKTVNNSTDISTHNTDTLTAGPSEEHHDLGTQSIPDQDYGYSSLEEEQVQRRRVTMETSQREEQENQQVQVREEESSLEEGVRIEALTAPQCHNKTIAFIMGCPCSDDSQSEEESDDDDDDDDDGFDSEGSSYLSESSELDEDDQEDSDLDSEAERLWTSLSRSVDPYNPRNFTARLHTSAQPKDIPRSTPPSSAQSTPASSPPGCPLSASPLLSSSCSPPLGQDSWDDSTSASEVDEVESLRLLNSFSCSSDPYSPFNFQAPLRTQAPSSRVRASKASQTPSHSPNLPPAAPPKYKTEEAEERLDSGFSESHTTTSSSTQRISIIKKVRFSEVVEEFFASSPGEEEDRRGPWEELARDRCRFLRRCLEVEERISFCLQPQHRRRVYLRLTTTTFNHQDQ